MKGLFLFSFIYNMCVHLYYTRMHISGHCNTCSYVIQIDNASYSCYILQILFYYYFIRNILFYSRHMCFTVQDSKVR